MGLWGRVCVVFGGRRLWALKEAEYPRVRVMVRPWPFDHTKQNIKTKIMMKAISAANTESDGNRAKLRGPCPRKRRREVPKDDVQSYRARAKSEQPGTPSQEVSGIVAAI